MCKVYNQIGSLTTIKTHLHNHNIYDFKSINELITFQKNYPVARQQLIENSSLQIAREKEILEDEIALLADFIDTCRSENTKILISELEQLKHQLTALSSAQSNFFEKITIYFQRNSIQSKIRNIETNFDSKIANPIFKYTDLYAKKNHRFKYIDHHFEEAVKENTHTQLRDLERKKTIVDELTPSIYGAIGEQKVSSELQHLSDDYILINDFSCTFHPALYRSQEDDYIKSVQIDQILIAPAGIFLIETKNWSEESLTNLTLRSPVDQIKRTSYALYRTLNGEEVSSILRLN